MNRNDVLQHYRDSGALLEGHFLLSSGLHSPVYMQSAKVLMHPQRAEALCKALAAKITAALGPNPVDIVCSPAMGGVVVGYELARQLGVPAIFTERVDSKLDRKSVVSGKSVSVRVDLVGRRILKNKRTIRTHI